MRFFKLRIAVAVALFISLLIIFNIIAFGLMQKRTGATNNQVPELVMAQVTEAKKITPEKAAPAVTTVKPATLEKKSSSPAAKKTPVAQPASDPAPIIIMHQRRTRAS